MQRKARGVPFGHSKQATSNAALRQNYPPSLRVASKCGACGVALLAKGTTLGFVARLAVIRIWRQRVSCDECQQTLEHDRLVWQFVAPPAAVRRKMRGEQVAGRSNAEAHPLLEAPGRESALHFAADDFPD